MTFGTRTASAWLNLGCPSSGRTRAGTRRTRLPGDQLRPGTEPCSKVCPVLLLNHDDVQRLIGIVSLDTGVFLLQLLQRLPVIRSNSAALISPSVVRLLSGVQHLCQRRSLTQLPISLPKFTYDLLRLEMCARHLVLIVLNDNRGCAQHLDQPAR